MAGVPYDGQDPAYADLYGEKWNDTKFWYEQRSDVGPPAFEKNFEDRLRDLMDKYHPDLYYTDGGIRFTRSKDNTVLYVINQGWSNDQVVVRTLGSSRIDLTTLTGVTMLGSAGKLTYSQDAGGFAIKVRHICALGASGVPPTNTHGSMVSRCNAPIIRCSLIATASPNPRSGP